jgi:hypothetical protein
MMKTVCTISAMAMLLGCAGAATATPPADWSTVDSLETVVFYPGVSPMDWIRGRRHGGGRAFSRGETCQDCHAGEARLMGELIVAGGDLEPTPIAGKVGWIPVTVQAAHDSETLYLRFSWEQPNPGSTERMDAENPVKLAFMLDADKVATANQSGCWASCHADSKTMPAGKSGRTKYAADGSLSAGIFYDLMQWRSGTDRAYAGYVADQRVLEAADGLVRAQAERQGNQWSVVFARRFAGNGTGNLTLVSGHRYNFGFAIHDDHAEGRFHHVSLEYTLGIDTEADIEARKQ